MEWEAQLGFCTVINYHHIGNFFVQIRAVVDLKGTESHFLFGEVGSTSCVRTVKRGTKRPDYFLWPGAGQLISPSAPSSEPSASPKNQSKQRTGTESHETG